MVVVLHLIHISTHVDSSLLDGDYVYISREEQTEVQPTQTDVQLHQAEATQDLMQYQEETATQQAEGKPRCIFSMFKTTRTYVYLIVH